MREFETEHLGKTDLSLADFKLHNVGYEACHPLQAWSGMRDFYSLHTVAVGCGFYELGDSVIPLCQGDSFLLYPNTKARYWADESDPWEYIWLGISGIYVKNILEYTDFTEESPCLYGEGRIALTEEFLEIYQVKGENFPSELEKISKTYHLFSKLITKKAVNQNKSSVVFAQRAKEFMELNYSSGITATQVADKMNLSRSHLHRVFSENFGISVGKYINQLQMNRAKFLLVTTQLSIGEISNSIGFENQLYFSNVFKKFSGRSPSEYRKERIS